MSILLPDIFEWAAQLEYWERVTLDKIIAGEQLTPDDYDWLFQLMLEDKGLDERKGPRPEILFTRRTGNSGSFPVQPVRLMEISNLQNINALISDQKITFDRQLTIIYGANGSGKSGYARVLGQAGFSRGDKDVLSDISKPRSNGHRRSARILVADENGERTIDFEIGINCSELASLYVFDSTSVKVHLNEQNTISFTPSGLSYLTALAAETDRCRDRLRERIANCRQTNSFGSLFQGESGVNRLIASLGPKTNLKELQKLAILSTEDENRFNDLETQIGRLKSEDITETLNGLDIEIDDLQGLINNIRATEESLNDQVIGDLKAAIAEFKRQRAVAHSASIEQFRSKIFTQTGSPVWHEFIKAAKMLAEAETEYNRPYPQAEDHCLFCRQSLNSDARDLIIRLWDYLKNEAQTKLEEVKRELDENENFLKTIKLDYFNDQHVAYRHLEQYNPELKNIVIAFFQVAGCRREKTLHAISDLTECSLPQLPDNGIARIESIIEGLRGQRTKLAAQDRKDEITRLEKELLELKHRALLGEHWEAISTYVEKQKWVMKAEKSCGTTVHITKKYNELFEKRVTERYKGLFEQLLKEMGRPLKVHIDTKGKKGATIKQIALETEDKRITPDKVLSEGEKRAVAMADFLTEIILNEASGGIVLDDPVTSLDSDWKDVVAQKLVDEAQRRQVIIFTHDIQFTQIVNRHAELKKISLVSHRISRNGPSDQPGFVELNYNPIQEKSYLDTARVERFCTDAEKAASSSERENLLRQGFAALRSCYEAFVAHDLLVQVVRRFDPRISVGSLKDVVLDRSIVEETITKYEFLSRYIEGHLPIDVLEISPPTSTLLKKEILAFQELRSRLRKLKKPQ